LWDPKVRLRALGKVFFHHLYILTHSLSILSTKYMIFEMHKCKFDAQKIQKKRLKTQPFDSYLVMWVPTSPCRFHSLCGICPWILRSKFLDFENQTTITSSFFFFFPLKMVVVSTSEPILWFFENKIYEIKELPW
jgi:hypothetical protein